MSEKQINKAIETGKLPLNISDIISIFFLAASAIAIIYVSILAYNIPTDFKTLTTGLCVIAVIILFIFFLIWHTLASKRIVSYGCALSFDKKTFVLEKLTSSEDISSLEKENRCYSFYYNLYRIKIMYDNSGYYVNSTYYSQRLKWRSIQEINLSIGESNEIIKKIKALEAGRPEK